MPLDPEPTDEGHVYFNHQGKLAYKRKTIPGEPPYYTSHFATCPDAPSWRAP
jgi:hypothetical protein